MKTNVVLIGMTGSGKSTIGELLSAEFDMAFVDVDQFIEQKANQSIPELFEVSETHFRSLETQACKELAATKIRTVISCGGGSVLNPANIEVLKETGWVVFIDRPVEHITKDIEVEHRPLLKDGRSNLYQLYEERINLYEAAADFIVENTSTIEQVIANIEKNLPKSIKSKKES